MAVDKLQLEQLAVVLAHLDKEIQVVQLYMPHLVMAHQVAVVQMHLVKVLFQLVMVVMVVMDQQVV